MKRVEIMVADDDANVRETFKDLIVDYKRDLDNHRRDDHLGILFNDDSFRIAPPLVITQDERNEMLNLINECLDKLD